MGSKKHINMKTSNAHINNKFSRNNKALFNYYKFYNCYKKIKGTPEPFLLKKFRKTAWTEMGKSFWGDLNREDWRYTKYDVFFPGAFISSNSYNITIKGLTDKDISAGVRAIKYPEQMSEVLPFIQDNGQTGYFYDKWTLLNASLFNRGVFVDIPKNYKAERTLYIQHNFAENGMEFPLTYIKLNEGSELNLIEEYNGGMHGLKHIISNTIINLAANSKLNHVFIQTLSRESRSLFYQNAVLGRDSEFQTHSVHLGSKTGRVIQNIEFREPGGYLKNYGLLYGCKKQHIDIETNQIHKAPHTGGELLYRHVLADRAKSIFKGKIVIEKGKTFCNATQKNENLLLSPKAEAISLPKLEISNDEVQCSHGVTISSIDDEQLFYLASRGIGMNEARKMIVEGFFEEIIKKSATQDIAEVISRKVKEVL